MTSTCSSLDLIGSGMGTGDRLLGGCTSAYARPTGCGSEEPVNNVIVNKRMGVRDLQTLRNIGEVTTLEVHLCI